MKYTVVHFEYQQARDGNPFLFTVEGEPTTLAEWKQYGGKTRETKTQAEIEAMGLTVPGAFTTSAAEAAKRADEKLAEATTVRAELDAVKAELDAVKAQYNSLVAKIQAFVDALNKS